MNIKETLGKMVKSFFPYAKERLGFTENPRVFLRSDAENASNPLGKTAYYDPSSYQIVLYINDRHPKDILRSFSHELVHHLQNCRGDFEQAAPATEGYAQEDDHLREMEREAYEQGNLIIRDWEDQLKKENKWESLMESNTKKIEKEIADVKKNRGDESTRKIRDDIQDAFSRRHEKMGDELMRRWGFNKKEKDND